MARPARYQLCSVALPVVILLACVGCSSAPRDESPASPAPSAPTAGGESKAAPAAPGKENQEQVSQVIAKVNGKPLYKAFYEQILSFMRNRLAPTGDSDTMGRYLNAKFDALDRLIEDELIYQEAQRQGIKVPDDAVQQDYERMASSAGGEEAFLSAMYKQHITKDGALEAVRKKLTLDQFVKQTVEPLVHVSENEITEYYNTHLKKFTPHRWSLVEHVLIACPAGAPADVATRAALRAAKIAANARAGVPFEQLAREFSEDAVSAPRGGSLGWMKKGESSPEFEATVAGLSPGQISDPVRTEYGYHIVKVVETKGGDAVPLTEVRDACRDAVATSKKAEILHGISSQLRSSAEIVSYLN